MVADKAGISDGWPGALLGLGFASVSVCLRRGWKTSTRLTLTASSQASKALRQTDERVWRPRRRGCGVGVRGRRRRRMASALSAISSRTRPPQLQLPDQRIVVTNTTAQLHRTAPTLAAAATCSCSPPTTRAGAPAAAAAQPQQLCTAARERGGLPSTSQSLFAASPPPPPPPPHHSRIGSRRRPRRTRLAASRVDARRRSEQDVEQEDVVEENGEELNEEVEVEDDDEVEDPAPTAEQLRESGWALPMRVKGNVTVLSAGKIYDGPDAHLYWTDRRAKRRHPYPVGYSATKRFKNVLYWMRILAGHEGPIFEVWVDGSADATFRGGSAADAWSNAMEGLGIASVVNGRSFFGFNDTAVQDLLLSLPGANEASSSAAAASSSTSNAEDKRECARDDADSRLRAGDAQPSGVDAVVESQQSTAGKANDNGEHRSSGGNGSVQPAQAPPVYIEAAQGSSLRAQQLRLVIDRIRGGQLSEAFDVVKTMIRNGLDVNETVYNLFFKFEMDLWQRQAVRQLNDSNSVLLCAPAGAGKTAVAEYAIYQELAAGRRVAFVTPLKGLAGQRYRNFVARFGANRVGAIWGDLTVNMDAPVVVMTVDIFRALSFAHGARGVDDIPVTCPGSMDGVALIVLDEFHTVSDKQRGTMWQESLLYAPKIRLLAMSAVAGDADVVAAWLRERHGPTSLVVCTSRPVPHSNYFCKPGGMHPLLNDEQNGLNYALRASASASTPRRIATTSWRNGNGARREQKFQTRGSDLDSQRSSNRTDTLSRRPSLRSVLWQLQQKNMYPAIFFIFSRYGCQNAMREAARVSTLSLVTEEEGAAIRARLRVFLDAHPGYARQEEVAPLLRGIAAHHAGILPEWRQLVEDLCLDGLIKLVFGTESLAAGLKIFVRTVVLSSVGKKNEAGHRLLLPSEFHQLIGRAGRRGFDSQGNIVFLQTSQDSAEAAASLCMRPPVFLNARFMPAYGTTLNLLRVHSVKDLQKVLSGSLSDFTMPAGNSLSSLTTPVDEESLQQLHHVQQVVVAELASVEEELSSLNPQQVADALKTVSACTLVELSTSRSVVRGGEDSAMPGVLLAEVPGPQPHYICLCADNMFRMVPAARLVSVHSQQPPLDAIMQRAGKPLAVPAVPSRDRWKRAGPNEGFVAEGDASTSETAAAVSQAFVNTPALDRAARVPALQREVLRLKRRLANITSRIKNHQKRAAEDADPDSNKGSPATTQLSLPSMGTWTAVQPLLSVLMTMSAVQPSPEDPERYTLTTLGKAAAVLRTENELWVAQVLLSDAVIGLTPAELAGAVSAITTEGTSFRSRHDSDTWSDQPITNALQSAMQTIRELQSEMVRVHRANNVKIPILFETAPVTLTYAWANGASWEELINFTALDDGDLVRVLRRTVELLKQVPLLPGVGTSVADAASKALEQMSRFPIASDSTIV